MFQRGVTDRILRYDRDPAPEPSQPQLGDVDPVDADAASSCLDDPASKEPPSSSLFLPAHLKSARVREDLPAPVRPTMPANSQVTVTRSWAFSTYLLSTSNVAVNSLQHQVQAIAVPGLAESKVSDRRSQTGGVRQGELDRRSQTGGDREEELDRRSQAGGVRQKEFDRRSQSGGIIKEEFNRMSKTGGVSQDMC